MKSLSNSITIHTPSRAESRNSLQCCRQWQVQCACRAGLETNVRGDVTGLEQSDVVEEEVLAIATVSRDYRRARRQPAHTNSQSQMPRPCTCVKLCSSCRALRWPAPEWPEARRRNRSMLIALIPCTPPSLMCSNFRSSWPGAPRTGRGV